MHVSAAMSSPYSCQFEGFCVLCAHLWIPSGVEGFGRSEPDTGHSVHSADFVTLSANRVVPMSFLPAGRAGVGGEGHTVPWLRARSALRARSGHIGTVLRPVTKVARVRS